MTSLNLICVISKCRMVVRYDPFRCIFLLPIFMFKMVCTKTQHHSNSVKIHLSHYYIDHFVTVSGYNLDRSTVLWTYQGWGYGAGILAQASTTSPWIRLCYICNSTSNATSHATRRPAACTALHTSSTQIVYSVHAYQSVY